MINIVYNADCLPAMQKMKDNQFDLAIVDPIYLEGFSTDTWVDYFAENKEYKNRTKTLEVKTDKYYFKELLRITKNQIIWGGNYFVLPISRGWVVWDKDNGVDNYFSDCELAWTSFNKILKKYRYRWQGMLQEKMGRWKEDRIHPTQKPIQLYKWLLKNYAKEGDTILDTHVGSGSSRIACYEMGFSFEGYEIDIDYWQAQEKRFNIVKNQQTFKFKKIDKIIVKQLDINENY